MLLHAAALLVVVSETFVSAHNVLALGKQSRIAGRGTPTRMSELQMDAAKAVEEIDTLRSIAFSQASRLAKVQGLCNTTSFGDAAEKATPDLSKRRLTPDLSKRRLAAALDGVGMTGWSSDSAVYNGFKMSFSNSSTIGVATSTEEVLWFILCGTAGTIMLAGFICIEAGSLPAQDSNIAALRALVGVCGATIAWWLTGFAIAFGGPYDAEGRIENRWIGTQNFFGGGFTGSWTIGTWFVIQPKGVASAWYMEWILSVACVAIVSGGTAGRFGIMGHCIVSIAVSGLIYPFFVAQLKGGGWISRTHLEDAAVVDFAGSGFVHLVGGTFALIVCCIAGARKGRFSLDGRRRKRLVPGRPPLVAFGTLLLWCGWNGVLAGAPRRLPDLEGVERCAQAIVNTTVAASAGGIVSFLLRMLITGLTRKAIDTARAPHLAAGGEGSMVVNVESADFQQKEAVPDMRMSMGVQGRFQTMYNAPTDEVQKGIITRHMPRWSWHVVFGERGINANSVSAGIRAGLAAIAAGAGSMHSAHAFVVGAVGGGLCEGASCLLIIFKIDDPVDAFAAHAVAGFWGLVAAAFFDYGSGEKGASFHGNSGWKCKTGTDGQCILGIWDDAVITQILAGLLFVAITIVLLCAVILPLYKAGVVRRPDAQPKPKKTQQAKPAPTTRLTASSEVLPLQNAGNSSSTSQAAGAGEAPKLAIEAGDGSQAQ